MKELLKNSINRIDNSAIAGVILLLFGAIYSGTNQSLGIGIMMIGVLLLIIHFIIKNKLTKI